MLYKPEPVYHQHLMKILQENVDITFGLEPKATDYTILIGGRPSSSILKNSQNLHSLVIPFAGIPKETSSLLHNFPHIALHNIHHNAAITAEMAIALMLAATKKIVPIDRQFRNHDWQGRMISSPLLSGKNALILGYGAIGKRVANVCHALGMQVTALRRNSYPEDGDIKVRNIDMLDEALPQANVVMVCLPQTQKTTNLLCKKRLNLLPTQTVIVNIGRAAIINEKALFDALSDNKLCAGLDVWYNYPKEVTAQNFSPSNLPFRELENIVMSPHRAGRCDEVEFLRMEHIAQLVNVAANGDEMPNKIDINRGY
ncbi:NAD(P)-dependent oxidoreductase [Candidatus Uabimicrobium amorphum]|nr:NAD(P)-dependent oxidoreductase [Candidatus Uabimicrobium amorphum]